MTIMKTTSKVIETIDNETEDSMSDGESGVSSTAEIESDEGNDEISDIPDDSGNLSNLGWADSISKILRTNKPKKKKSIVLSKAKKLTDIRKPKPKPAGFEVETVDGKVKEEQIEPRESILKDEPPKKKKKDVPSLRLKPDVLERHRERTLQKIATKGVVQLFNAVKMQQKDISKKLEIAGPLEVRKEKVLKNIDKRAFLDVLMGEKSEKIDDISLETKKENNSCTTPTWSVLREDFMLGAKMKDWDKQMEVEEEVNVESE